MSEPIRMSMRSSEGRYEIRGLEPREMEAFDSFLCAQAFVALDKDGRLHTHPVHKPLPDPTDDVMLMDHWRKTAQVKVHRQFFNPERLDDFGASIQIQHLCGYGWSEQSYKLNAQRLESYGFDCLRSRRGKDGHYWEIWHLPFLDFAKGDLQRAVGKDKPKLERVIDFLCKNVAFGTLDVSYQRAAMVVD